LIFLDDNFSEQVRMTKSKLYALQDPNKLLQELKPNKKIKNFEEDSYYSVENNQQFSSKLDGSLLNQNEKLDISRDRNNMTNDKSYISKHKKKNKDSRVIWNHEDSKFFTIEK
jgi:hypothetical protein